VTTGTPTLGEVSGYTAGAMLLTVLLLSWMYAQEPGPARPSGWAAFSADLRHEPADKIERGRFVQDEHGCTRHEFYYADGTLSVSLLNLAEQKSYSLREGVWTWHRARLFDHRPPAPLALKDKAEPVEGLETYRRVHTVRTGGGDIERDDLVVPALNDYVVRHATPDSVVVAHNIKPGPQDHREFSPPEGAYLMEGIGRGPYNKTYPLLLRVTFPNQKPVEIRTVEGGSDRLPTPGGQAWSIDARIVDERPTNVVVRVRMFMPGATPRDSTFVVLEELEFPLAEGGATRTLNENFTITVTRIAAGPIR
jgi:hypothetical protein